MITVHHLETSRSQRVLWLLEELGVPYDIKLYKRNPATRLAPPELKAVHPLGKSPVITDDGQIVAESAVILEHLADRYADKAQGDLAHLQPPKGTPAHAQSRFWMHYAEGSLMPWLVMKLVFLTIPTQPMPFFVRPIASQLCKQVRQKLVNPNLNNGFDFIEKHLAAHTWFAGEHLSLADFQMSFVIEVAMARGADMQRFPRMAAYKARMEARPAYQRALAKGGPVVMA